MNQRILFVDDEPNILMAFRRQFRSHFDIETANNGRDALHLIANGKSFAVIISDLSMPVMDGIQFLTQAKELLPDGVRILLTGHADLSTAIEAINHGDIFRFLTKPCASKLLQDAINAGLEQYRLITAEKDLLEETLGKTVNLMSNMLVLANPIAYSRAIRIRHIVQKIVRTLNLKGGWQFELAALLSQTGCIVLSNELLDRIDKKLTITQKEANLYESHPLVGYRLLRNIPRLESIAEMVRDQQRPYSSYADQPYSYQSYDIELGAKILKVVIDYDNNIHNGYPHVDIIQDMLRKTAIYDTELVEALNTEDIEKDPWETKLTEMIFHIESGANQDHLVPQH